MASVPKFYQRILRKGMRLAAAKARQLGREEGRLEVLAGFSAVKGVLDSPLDHVRKAAPAEPPAPPPETDPTPDPYHALILAMLDTAIEAREAKQDPAPRMEALRKLIGRHDQFATTLERYGTDAETIAKAIGVVYLKARGWDQAKHPRDQDGRFISKDKIHAARNDPSLARELRARVRPEDRDKLDDAISGKSNIGRTARGEAQHQAGIRRKVKEENHARATQLIKQLYTGQYHDLTGDDMHALADHLPRMNVAELRRARMAMRGSFGGSTKRDGMVQALVAHARNWAKDLAADQPKLRGQGRQWQYEFDDGTKSQVFMSARDAKVAKDENRLRRPPADFDLDFGMDAMHAPGTVPVRRFRDEKRDMFDYKERDRARAAQEEAREARERERDNAAPRHLPETNSQPAPTTHPAEAVMEQAVETHGDGSVVPKTQHLPPALAALADVGHDPDALRLAAETAHGLSMKPLHEGGTLATHDAMIEAVRGEHGQEVKGAVERGMDDWNAHRGDTAKKFARIGEELAKAGFGKGSLLKGDEKKPAPEAGLKTPTDSGQQAMQAAVDATTDKQAVKPAGDEVKAPSEKSQDHHQEPSTPMPEPAEKGGQQAMQAALNATTDPPAKPKRKKKA